MIHLTYSPRAAKDSKQRLESDTSYLQYLENQREELKKAVMEAPRHRLDHLATFVETHSERMSHILEALISYRHRFFRFRLRQLLYGGIASMMGAGAAVYVGVSTGLLGDMGSQSLLFPGVIGTAILLLLWTMLIMPFMGKRFFRKQVKNIDTLTPLENQTRRDCWDAVRERVLQYLNNTGGKYPKRKVKQDHEDMLAVFEKGSREIREAIRELAALKPGVPVTDPPGPFLATIARELEENNRA